MENAETLKSEMLKSETAPQGRTPFRLQLARWGQGLLAGCVQGGAIAAKAYAGAAVLSTVGCPELALSLKQGAAVFVSGGLWHLWDYLASNPLPDIPDPTLNPQPSTLNPPK